MAERETGKETSGVCPHTGHRERIREQYTLSGIDALQPYQVLELLLTYAIPRRDTKPIAHALIERYGSLERIFTADVTDLVRTEGVGERCAVFLRLQGDVARRVQLDRLRSADTLNRLTDPRAAAQYASALLSLERIESVWGVCLDRHGSETDHSRITTGSLDEAPVYPRQIVEYALQRRAAAFILIHNHPSGSPLPSGADREVTVSVRNALSAIDVRLTDHLVTGGRYVYSFTADAVIDVKTDCILTPAEYSSKSRR